MSRRQAPRTASRASLPVQFEFVQLPAGRAEPALGHLDLEKVLDPESCGPHSELPPITCQPPDLSAPSFNVPGAIGADLGIVSVDPSSSVTVD